MTPEEERNLAAAKRWTELYNSKADEWVHECNAPDYEARTFPGEITLSGIENLGAAYKNLQKIIPDRRQLVRRIMAGGDSVAIEMNYRGTVAKETEGMPPVGKIYEKELCIVLRFRDGLVISEYVYG